MEFCPTCANMLKYAPNNSEIKGSSLRCPTCPYVARIEKQVKLKKRQPLVKKQIEPIFSGAHAMALAPKTQATCPSCMHGEAYFHEFQTRSADEPMTRFYECCKCSRHWRED